MTKGDTDAHDTRAAGGGGCGEVHGVGRVCCGILPRRGPTGRLPSGDPPPPLPSSLAREGDPGRGGLQGARPRAWQLGGPASRGLTPPLHPAPRVGLDTDILPYVVRKESAGELNFRVTRLLNK
eukprot:1182883-Prorocentrum_minimum.AAC.2